ncbi:MAG: rhodanese-like domain-containing protein [Methylococcales bacterium]|nr:rhodanese-like domain-containing protein [Methylococcaceae bacterium]
MDRYLEFILNHYWLSIALAVVTFLLIQEFFDTTFKKFSSVSPLEAVTKMNDGNTVVVDVREPDEYKVSHVVDAINAPLSKLNEQLVKLEAHKKGSILLACQNGTRSAAAAKILTKAGFEQVFVITGGMQAWEVDYKLPIRISKK